MVIMHVIQSYGKLLLLRLYASECFNMACSEAWRC